MSLRYAIKLLPAIVLAACGAPGTPDPWVQLPGSRQAAATDSAAAQVPAPAQPARPEDKLVRGSLRRVVGVPIFRPCGASVSLRVEGNREAVRALSEAFRWTAVYMERPLFAVLLGSVAADSAAADGGPTRFVLARFDSLRAWQAGDCGLPEAPRW